MASEIIDLLTCHVANNSIVSVQELEKDGTRFSALSIANSNRLVLDILVYPSKNDQVAIGIMENNPIFATEIHIKNVGTYNGYRWMVLEDSPPFFGEICLYETGKEILHDPLMESMIRIRKSLRCKAIISVVSAINYSEIFIPKMYAIGTSNIVPHTVYFDIVGLISSSPSLEDLLQDQTEPFTPDLLEFYKCL